MFIFTRKEWSICRYSCSTPEHRSFMPYWTLQHKNIRMRPCDVVYHGGRWLLTDMKVSVLYSIGDCLGGLTYLSGMSSNIDVYNCFFYCKIGQSLYWQFAVTEAGNHFSSFWTFEICFSLDLENCCSTGSWDLLVAPTSILKIAMNI